MGVFVPTSEEQHSLLCAGEGVFLVVRLFSVLLYFSSTHSQTENAC